jgi:hypothetical protein
MIKKSQYKGLREFKKRNSRAYREAESRGLIPVICKRYGWRIRKPINSIKEVPIPKEKKWSKTNIMSMAKKSYTYGCFQQEFRYGYSIAIKEGWENELYEYFKNKEWEDNRELRLFNSFTQTEDFRYMFEQYKEKNKNNTFIGDDKNIMSDLVSSKRKQLTIEGLKKTKEKGTKLGSPQNLNTTARKKGLQVVQRNRIENERWREAITFIEDFQMKNGYINCSEIARELNSNSYKTRRGNEFSSGTVKRLLLTKETFIKDTENND